MSPQLPLMEKKMTAQKILQEVDDDYGLPTARYRAPTDFADQSLVEDMSGCIWRSVHAPEPHWVELDRQPTEDDDWGILLKSDTFHDHFEGTQNRRYPTIYLNGDDFT